MAGTVTFSQTNGSNGCLLDLRVVTGQNASPIGASVSSKTITSPNEAITPAASGSLVYGSIGMGGSSTFTAETNSTFKSNSVMNSSAFGSFKLNTATTAGTPVTVGASGPGPQSSGDIDMAVLEIKNGASVAEDASTPAAAVNSAGTSVTTASFTPPAGSILVAMTGGNFSSAGVIGAITDTFGLGLVWTEQIAGKGASTGYAAVWTAVVPSGVTGTVAAHTHKPVTAAAGNVEAEGAIAAHTHKASVSATGGLTISGTVAASAHKAVAASAGNIEAEGAVAVHTHKPVTASAGTYGPSAAVASAAHKASVAIVAAVVSNFGPIAVSSHKASVAVTGTETISGTVAAHTHKAVVAAIAAFEVSGPVAAHTHKPAIAVSGAFIPVTTGTVAAHTHKPAVAATAFAASIVAAVAVKTHKAVVASAGTFVPAPPPPTPYMPPSFGAGLAGDISCEILDTSLVSQGPIELVTMSATLYYNQVGSWAAACAYDPDLWDLIQTLISGGGFELLFNWGGQFKFGGRCEIPGYQSSIPGATNAAVFTVGKMIIFSGADWLALIANRLAFPNPTVAWASQSLAAADAVTSVAQETAIKHYVTRNTGSGATALRQVPFLSVASDLARGSTVSYNVKFAAGADLALMDIIRNIEALGNHIGVKIDLTDSGLVFDTYIPRDLSNFAYFAESLGNLVSVGLQIEDPTITDALVLGQSALLEETGPGYNNPWARIETLVDQFTSADATQNAQAGLSAIASGAATPMLSVSAQDIPRLQFGTDYFLGDKVTVGITDSDTYTDIVSQVDLVMDAAQVPPVTVTPTIGVSSVTGNSSPTLTAQLVQRIRRLERRLDTRIG